MDERVQVATAAVTSAGDASLATAAPRYARLAQAIAGEIEKGSWQVGTLLPSEPTLAARYGVSRHTVREALRRLVERGLLRREQGVGTQVVAPSSATSYVARIDSLDQLMSYTEATRLRVLGHRRITRPPRGVPDAVEPGWTIVRCLRELHDSGTVIACIDIFLHPWCEGVVAQLGDGGTSVYKLIEQHCSVSIDEVEQEAGVVRIGVAQARALGVAEGSPGMRVLRCYYARDHRLLSISVNTYPPDRFRLSLKWSRTTRAALPHDDR